MCAFYNVTNRYCMHFTIFKKGKQRGSDPEKSSSAFACYSWNSYGYSHRIPFTDL